MKKLLIWLLTGALIGGNIYMVPKAYETWQMYVRVSEQEEISAKILYPMVRIEAKLERGQSKGSGVVVFSEPVKDMYHTYVLTCAHLFGAGGPIAYDKIKEIRVKIFTEEKSWHDLNAVIIVADVERDLALLKLETTEKYAAAVFAPQEVFDTIQTFEKVYHIGTMFGQEIHPVVSHIAQRPQDGVARTHGPIYPGYSGGPCYLAGNMTLIGLNQRINSYRTSPVSAVNVATVAYIITIDLIKDWLDESGHGFIYNKKLNEAVLETISRDGKKLEMAPELKAEAEIIEIEIDVPDGADPEAAIGEALKKAIEKTLGPTQ